MYRGQTADEALDALKREADASEKAFLDHLAGRTGSRVDPVAARLAATATYEERLLSGPNDPRLKRLPSEAWEPQLPKEKAPYGQAGPPGASQHPWPVRSTSRFGPVRG